MKLTRVRVQNYRSVRDTGWFEVEEAKTILVGPNEAGKTAILEALQQINPPNGVRGFDPLRDYPRKQYNADIQSGRLDPENIPVASARFELEADDLVELPDGFGATGYECTRYLNNGIGHKFEGGPQVVVLSNEIRKDLQRLATHVEKSAAEGHEDDAPGLVASLDDVIGGWQVGATTIAGDRATELRNWLDSILELVDENNTTEDERHTRLLEYTHISEQCNEGRRDAPGSPTGARLL